MGIFKRKKKERAFVVVTLLLCMIAQFVPITYVSAQTNEREYIKPLQENTAPKIFLASDSTCEDLPDSWYPREGWGMEIGKYFQNNVKIVNKAKGGKSTRSFLNDWDAPAGVYDSRMTDIAKQSTNGDWLFVQFGHNDYNNNRENVKTNPDTLTDNGDFTSYRHNLKRFIDFADDNHLNIVFLTPIHILTSFSGGKLNSDGLDGYRKAMTEVGEENGVPVLQVGEEHKALIESLGADRAKEIFMFVSREDYPNLPADVSTADTTHINQTGADQVSKIIINEIKRLADDGDELMEKLYSYVNTDMDTTLLQGDADSNPDDSEQIEDNSQGVSLVPGKNNAYILFGEEITTNYMSFEDAINQGITAISDPLYSEKVEIEGVQARKVYADNIVYMSLDRDYFKPGDHRFLVTITYYDFGPDVGYFYFDYNSCDETIKDELSRSQKRITITKPGIIPKWTTIRLYIDDADFAGKMNYGADMRLATRTYNAFAKVEIVNVDELERNNSMEELPVVNSAQAETLSMLGLYESDDENGSIYPLEQTMTRIECLETTLNALGYKAQINTAPASGKYTDLTSDQAKIVGLAEQLGILPEPASDKFDPDGVQIVNDAAAYFLRYLGVESDNNYEDALALVTEKNLVMNTDFVIFKNNPLSRDNFVAMAYNVLTLNRAQTQTVVVGELMERDIITVDDLKKTGVPEFAAYEYYKPIKVPKKVINDKESGRQYYYMNFNGKIALKPYVSVQTWNYDGTKFVFGCRQTNAMYEYDIVNETVKFLDHAQVDGVHLNAVVLPNDVIYYETNGKGLWKMDWKTGEKEFVANQQFTIMSVTNDETYCTGYYSGGDHPGTLARLNIKTGQLENHLYKDFQATDPNSAGVGHPQINPEYPELHFFCNEGTDTLIHDCAIPTKMDTEKLQKTE